MTLAARAGECGLFARSRDAVRTRDAGLAMSMRDRRARAARNPSSRAARRRRTLSQRSRASRRRRPSAASIQQPACDIELAHRAERPRQSANLANAASRIDPPRARRSTARASRRRRVATRRRWTARASPPLRARDARVQTSALRRTARTNAVTVCVVACAIDFGPTNVTHAHRSDRRRQQLRST